MGDFQGLNPLGKTSHILRLLGKSKPVAYWDNFNGKPKYAVAVFEYCYEVDGVTRCGYVKEHLEMRLCNHSAKGIATMLVVKADRKSVV